MSVMRESSIAEPCGLDIDLESGKATGCQIATTILSQLFRH